MAIRELGNEEGKAVFELDNGDLKALNMLVEKFKVVDKATFLRYMLATFKFANDETGESVYVKKGIDFTQILPNEEIIKKN
jgi:hypothetical protein